MDDRPDFIEVYDNAVDGDTCAAIVARLRSSEALRPGRVGGGVFPELKHSRDLPITGNPEWVEKGFDYENQQGVSTGKILGFLKPKFYSQYSGGTTEDFGVIAADFAQ